MLLVTHDLGEAAYLAEQITLLHEGKVVQSGTYRRAAASSRRSVRDLVHQCAAHACRTPPRSRPDAAARRCAVRRHARGRSVALAAAGIRRARAESIVVGGKIFTESYVLGEIAAQSIEAQSTVPVERKLGMGSTGILFEALKSGAIDVYPDYTGTLAEAILKRPELKSVEEIGRALAAMDLVISAPLGFNNTYAIAVKDGLRRASISCAPSAILRACSRSLRAAFSYEFMDRKDGYPGMADSYQLKFDPQQGQSHGAQPDLPGDRRWCGGCDRRVFHRRQDQEVQSDACSKTIGTTFPCIKRCGWRAKRSSISIRRNGGVLRKLEGSISEEAMLDMNAQADIDKESVAKIAAQFLGAAAPQTESVAQKIWQRTREHLWLVGVSLLFSLIVGIPLGVMAVRFHAAGQGILIVSALVQTVPSLALLCFLIPVVRRGHEAGAGGAVFVQPAAGGAQYLHGRARAWIRCIWKMRAPSA